MKIEEILRYSGEGFNCAQIVCAAAAKKLGITEETAHLMAACLGGGMESGEVCGAFSGGLIAIGLKYGNGVPGDINARNKAKEKTLEFKKLFLQEYETLRCKELLGYDLSIPQEAAIIKEKEIIANICPQLIAYATEILDEIL